MADKFLKISFTDSVSKAQAHYYRKAQWVAFWKNRRCLRPVAFDAQGIFIY
jgi:hypothetical protein